MNLNVAIIMPPGAERDELVQHVEANGCAVLVADDVSQLLARGGDEGCSVGILDFGDPLAAGSTNGAATNGAATGGTGGVVPDQGMRREAVRLLKQRSPRMQLALWLDRSAAAEGAEMNELGIRNIFLKPIRFEPIETLLKAAGKSASQHAREQRETARVQEEFRFDRIVGKSAQIHESIELARSVARSGATSVLVLGESGVGKELFARAIHGESPRARGPFMEINCAAIPRELLESELFGHEKGAFTDATQLRVGLFEAAEHGSVFLDEVGELPLTLQAKLLKFLDSKIVRRVGGSRDIQVDVRILAATNRSLVDEVRQGRFREDLYYRLNVVPIEIPPLREREGDAALLATLFVERVGRKLGKNVRLTAQAEREIARYPWPGNVRELMNVIERAVLLAHGEEIGPGELAIPKLRERTQEPVDPADLGFRIPPEGISLIAVEKVVIEEALNLARGNVVEAARLLHIGRGSLRCKMRRHGLTREEPARASVA
ncbi:MAG TPA: sigma-54 dependent transcriptional regulator [Candidatus Eisenbacteria bacterium]|nr:sigma-54 dependent transcriptional regulator [Candidatus Eisenbacteria bacterium]